MGRGEGCPTSRKTWDQWAVSPDIGGLPWSLSAEAGICPISARASGAVQPWTTWADLLCSASVSLSRPGGSGRLCPRAAGPPPLPQQGEPRFPRVSPLFCVVTRTSPVPKDELQGFDTELGSRTFPKSAVNQLRPSGPC